MWGNKRELGLLRFIVQKQEKRIDSLEDHLDKLVEDLKRTNTGLSRVSLATGLSGAEIQREKVQ